MVPSQVLASLDSFSMASFKMVISAAFRGLGSHRATLSSFNFTLNSLSVRVDDFVKPVMFPPPLASFGKATGAWTTPLAGAGDEGGFSAAGVFDETVLFTAVAFFAGEFFLADDFLEVLPSWW